MHSPKPLWRAVVPGLMLVIGLTLAGMLFVAQADGHAEVEVIPRDANAYGNTYGEWSARWWQWALSVPTDTSPLLDTTGDHCAEAQSGSVWFLAGTVGGVANRTCTVPSGTALFFPILNTVFWGDPGDCTGPSDCDVTELREAAAASEDYPYSLHLWVDGQPFVQPSQLRVASPVFSFFLPAGNVVDLDPGIYGPAVSDGSWALLPPLGPGEHTIYFQGMANNGFAVEVTYYLTVTP